MEMRGLLRSILGREPQREAAALAPAPPRIFIASPILNKRSIEPALYGERFVKRRGLFSLSVTFTSLGFGLRKPLAQ